MGTSIVSQELVVAGLNKESSLRGEKLLLSGDAPWIFWQLGVAQAKSAPFTAGKL